MKYYSIIGFFALTILDGVAFFARAEQGLRIDQILYNKCLNNTTISESIIGCLICSRDKTLKRLKENRKIFGGSDSVTETGKIFNEIYQAKVWGEGGGGSGVGSIPSRAIGTGYIVRLVVFKLGLVSLLDAPCGAVHASWTKSVISKLKEEVPCFRYHGVDVAATVVKRNSASLLGTMPWSEFSTMDLSSSTAMLPRGFDLILSRDALQHLSYKHIAAALATYCRSDASYILIGSYLDAPHTENFKNIETGGCFAINILKSPFSFSAPLEIYPESAEADKAVVITNLNELPRKFLLLYDLRAFCSSTSVRVYIRQYM